MPNLPIKTLTINGTTYELPIGNNVAIIHLTADYYDGDVAWTAPNLVLVGVTDKDGNTVNLTDALEKGYTIYCDIENNGAVGVRRILQLATYRETTGAGDELYYFTSLDLDANDDFFVRSVKAYAYQGVIASVSDISVRSEKVAPLLMKDLSDVSYTGARPAENDLLRYTRTGGNVWKNSNS